MRLGPLVVAGAAHVGVFLASKAEAAKRENLAIVSSSLELRQARVIADGVLRLGRRHELHPLAVVCLDAGGNDVVVLREDGCGVMRTNIARGKAYASLSMVLRRRRRDSSRLVQ